VLGSPTDNNALFYQPTILNTMARTMSDRFCPRGPASSELARSQLRTEELAGSEKAGIHGRSSSDDESLLLPSVLTEADHR